MNKNNKTQENIFLDLEEAICESKKRNLKAIQNITVNKKALKHIEKFCEEICTYNKSEKTTFEIYYKSIPVVVISEQKELFKINYND